jgi:hypothetical protein
MAEKIITPFNLGLHLPVEEVNAWSLGAQQSEISPAAGAMDSNPASGSRAYNDRALLSRRILTFNKPGETKTPI